MNIKIHNFQQTRIAFLESEAIEINETQDALDMMADCNYQGAYKIVVHSKNLNPLFFDLKTKFAGEVLQKFSTYQVQLAIVGDFSVYRGKSLQDFIKESNRFGRINFVSSREEAIEKLLK